MNNEYNDSPLLKVLVVLLVIISIVELFNVFFVKDKNYLASDNSNITTNSDINDNNNNYNENKIINDDSINSVDEETISDSDNETTIDNAPNTDSLFQYDYTKSNEANLKSMRQNVDNYYYFVINDEDIAGYEGMGSLDVAEAYYFGVCEILSEQVKKLINNKDFQAIYPNYDAYFADYEENLKNYINLLGNILQEIDMNREENYYNCCADFTIYEIYRLDRIYNNKTFNFNDYTIKNNVDMDIALSRLIYDKARDNVNKLPSEYKEMLGKHEIIADTAEVRFGPGQEYDIIETYKKGQEVEVFEIAYADGEIWLNVAAQDWYYIKASEIFGK